MDDLPLEPGMGHAEGAPERTAPGHETSSSERSYRQAALVRPGDVAGLEDTNLPLAEWAGEMAEEAYPWARRQEAAETGLALATFPGDCSPFTLAQLRDDDFLPV